MKFNQYPKISVATDIVIFSTQNKINDDNRKVAEKGLQVFLIKRPIEPYINNYSLPGGFVDVEKDISQTAKEKLLLKTGIDNIYMEQLFTYGEPNRDIRGRVISIAYMAIVRKEDVKVNDGIWCWVFPKRDNNGNITDVTIETEKGTIVKSLAFDHKQIIIDAYNRIQNKIEYTDIAFHFLNKTFTVKELEMVYECIIGRKIQGFRRKIGNKIISTKIMSDDGSAHRPAELYKFNQNYHIF